MPRFAPLALLVFAGYTPAFAVPFGFLVESMIGWVCLLLFGGMVVGIIVLVRILARQGRLMNQAPPPRSGPVTFGGTADVQAVDDGFWILLPDTPVGSMARFRCRVGAAERISTFRYEPGPRGHFIHLGDRPYDIDVLHVLPPGQPFGPGGQGAQRRDRWDDAQDNSPSDVAGRPAFPDTDTGSSSGGGGGDFGRPPPDVTDPNAEDDSESGGGGDFGDPAPDVAGRASAVPDSGTGFGIGRRAAISAIRHLDVHRASVGSG